MIMFAVVVVVSRPAWQMGDLAMSPALLAVLASCFVYFRRDFRYGVTMAALLSAMLVDAQWLALQITALWLASGVGLFVVGWVIQFVGHYYEGRKPAFVNNLVGLIVGPLFVVAELGFLMGLRNEVQAAIGEYSGPVRRRSRRVAG